MKRCSRPVLLDLSGRQQEVQCETSTTESRKQPETALRLSCEERPGCHGCDRSGAKVPRATLAGLRGIVSENTASAGDTG